MSDDRDKLLHIMSSLEADYKSGKISKEKYIYFRSKYEDKLNSIDAVEATRRIRSMQGKPSAPKGNKRRGKKPAADKKRQEQDLVQKYILLILKKMMLNITRIKNHQLTEAHLGYLRF